MSTIQEKISADLKDAMKSRDTELSTILRGIIAKFREAEIACEGGRRALTEAESLQVLQRMLKPCRESLEMFEKAGRDDSVSKLQSEIKTIESYLPEPVSKEELEKVISDVVSKIEAPSMKDMGKIMGELKGRFGASLDAGVASPLVKAILSK